MLSYPRRKYSAYSSYNKPTRSFSHGGVTIKHREYIQDVSSSIGFSNLSFAFNPGLAATFPWLCNVASNFEEYTINYANVQFISTSADALNSTNTALGTIILVADYNAANPAFNTKQQMENSMLGISGKPSCDIRMPIDVRQKHSPLNSLYVRTVAVPTGTDQRLYDFCTFQLGTVGSQAAAVVGELWIDYSITFYKPILANIESAPRILYAHYSQTSWSNSKPLNGTTGVATLTKVYDNIGITISDTVITFPIGSIDVPFQMLVNWNGGNSGGAGTIPGISLGNVSAYNIVGANSTTQNTNAGILYANPTTGLTMVGFYTATDNSVSTLTFNTSGVLPAPSSSALDIFIIGLSLGDV